jgi:predicted Rossmann-fold nucleotide-binding protein
LIQTTKVQRKFPIVLYNEEFWKNVLNFDYLIEQGMIKEQDLDLFTYCNTPDEAFEYVTQKIIEAEEA